jgi:hypothetical protein
LDTLSTFVLRPSKPPRPTTMMSILKMIDYTHRSHNVYRRGTPIPLFGKRSLMRTSGSGSSSMRIGMSL